MTHGDLLLLDFSSEFSVDMKAGAGVVQGVVLKDPAHVVEQAGGRQHDGGRMEGVLPFEEEQGSGMETCRRRQGSLIPLLLLSSAKPLRLVLPGPRFLS